MIKNEFGKSTHTHTYTRCLLIYFIIKGSVHLALRINISFSSCLIPTYLKPIFTRQEFSSSIFHGLRLRTFEDDHSGIKIDG